jgi:hypothetical protein
MDNHGKYKQYYDLNQSDGIYYDRVNVKFDNAGDLIIIFKE